MSEDKSLLIVDDDGPFRQRLAQAMEKRGFAVVVAESVAAGIEAARTSRRTFTTSSPLPSASFRSTTA